MDFHTRIAPTPSGFLHLGNGASFVATWALAKAYGGKISLRIDDLDTERMRPEYVEDIFKTLDWLGIDWDKGAMSVGDFFKNWSQHHRLDIYEKMLDELKKTSLLYRCNCSRKDIQRYSNNGIYGNTCRENPVIYDNSREKNVLYEGNNAWRIRVDNPTNIQFSEFIKIAPLPSAVEQVQISLDTVMGDFIVRQKNGLPSYQLASLADDDFFNINFIVRGMDLRSSTAAQVFLAEQLGLTTFTHNTFWHHPLIMAHQGVKLSKSKGATALSEFRETGKSPVFVYKQAAQWLGLDAEKVNSLEDLREMLQIHLITHDNRYTSKKLIN